LKALLKFVFCLCCLSAVSACLFADNITLDVYPSGEELFEAFLDGDIDYQTYIILIEILENGIDSTEIYLLEEIPNVSYFLQTYVEEYSRLKKEQAESYLIPTETVDKERKTGFLRTRTYRELDREGRSGDYLYLKSRLNQTWSADLHLNRDSVSHRECSKRALIYKGQKGPVRRMTLGNFTARFGLGLTIGYRGRLLGENGESFEETLAFPDYGGFNGLYIEGGRRQDALRALLHFDRDRDFSFGAGALSFVRRYRNFKWEAIALGSILKNRNSAAKRKHYQLSGFLEYSREKFVVAAEAAFPRGASSSVPALVFETKFKDDRLDLKFSGWHYDEDFISLTGGARAGELYQTVTIDTVDFDFRDRRTNQDGVLLNSRVGFGGGVLYEFDISLYGEDSFRNSAKLLTTLEIPVGGYSVMGISFRNSRKKDFVEVRNENEYRLEYRFRKDALFLRSYLGYTDDKYGREYISCFARMRTDINGFGRVEVWLNPDRFDYVDGRLDYFYGYAQETIDVTSALELSAKFSYRYNRRYSQQEQLKFWLEVKLKW
jgi:hypothetical protein